MKLLNKWFFIPVACALLLACGGGGGGGGPSDGDPGGQVQQNVVSGTAAKGLIANGTVKVFALSAAGEKGPLLATVQTDTQGRYTANIGAYTGAVLVEASGPYIDESTGQTSEVSPAAPLRAALTGVGNQVTVAVTPFTELAVRRAEGGGGLSATRVQEANTLVSDLLRFDILTTLPVPPTAQNLAGAEEAQKTSTLALAALCQLAVERGQDIPRLLIDLNDEIATSGKLTFTTLDELAQATDTFLAGGQNQTGITDQSTTVVPKIGRSPGRLRLQVQGDTGAGAGAIGGVELRLILPEDARLATDGSGQVLDGAVALSPNLSESFRSVHYLPETATELAELRLALVSPSGFGSGEIATVDFEILGSSLPGAGDLSLASFTAVDGNGASLVGVSCSWVVEGR